MQIRPTLYLSPSSLTAQHCFFMMSFNFIWKEESWLDAELHFSSSAMLPRQKQLREEARKPYFHRVNKVMGFNRQTSLNMIRLQAFSFFFNRSGCWRKSSMMGLEPMTLITQNSSPNAILKSLISPISAHIFLKKKSGDFNLQVNGGNYY